MEYAEQIINNIMDDWRILFLFVDLWWNKRSIMDTNFQIKLMVNKVTNVAVVQPRIFL